MSFREQVLDILVAGGIAAVATVLLGGFVTDEQLGVTVGVILASMYYFSRNPWGATWEQAAELNARIDAVYDRVLP